MKNFDSSEKTFFGELTTPQQGVVKEGQALSRALPWSSAVSSVCEQGVAKPHGSSAATGLGALLHGIVLFDAITSETQRTARQIAESFSDSLAQPTPTLLYASLRQTSGYFKDVTHLYSTVLKELKQSPAGPEVRVVFCGNVLRGFAYALSRPAHVVFATSDNIHYRRYLENLGWSEWCDAMAAFFDLLQYPVSEREKIKRQLREFCERMTTLRFQSPASVSEKFTQRELERRFSKVIALLWECWQNESTLLPTEFPRFRHMEIFDPSSLATELSETEVFESRYAIAPAELGAAVEAVFERCVAKVRRRMDAEWQYALRDFQLEILCNDSLRIVENVSLTLPVYELTKTARMVLEHATEKICKKRSHREVFEDTVFEYDIVSIEAVRVTPIQLYCQRRSKNALFEFDGHKKSLIESKKLIEVKENIRTEAYKLGDDIFDRTSFCSVEDGQDEADDSFCRYLFQIRPVATLKQPVTLNMHELRKKFPQVKLVYTETVGATDCFIASLCPGKSAKLWLKTAVADRARGVTEREYQVAGFFGEDFELEWA